MNTLARIRLLQDEVTRFTHIRDRAFQDAIHEWCFEVLPTRPNKEFKPPSTRAIDKHINKLRKEIEQLKKEETQS